MPSFHDFQELLSETSTNRYSVEVNYRSTLPQVVDGFVQLVLGYISAAMKQANYHVKTILKEEPYRIIISARNFQDGEWVTLVAFNKEHNCFTISKGFFNRSRDTVTVQQTDRCDGQSAAEIYRALMNRMSTIQHEKPHHVGDLKPVKKQTGPQLGSMRPAQGLLGKGRPETKDRV